jgi:hypothetical protein
MAPSCSAHRCFERILTKGHLGEPVVPAVERREVAPETNIVESGNLAHVSRQIDCLEAAGLQSTPSAFERRQRSRRTGADAAGNAKVSDQKWMQCSGSERPLIPDGGLFFKSTATSTIPNSGGAALLPRLAGRQPGQPAIDLVLLTRDVVAIAEREDRQIAIIGMLRG